MQVLPRSSTGPALRSATRAGPAGVPTSVCQPSRVWSPVVGSCERGCTGSPAAVQNATFTCAAVTAVGQRCNATCRNGTVGNVFATCQATTFTWAVNTMQPCTTGECCGLTTAGGRQHVFVAKWGGPTIIKTCQGCDSWCCCMAGMVLLLTILDMVCEKPLPVILSCPRPLRMSVITAGCSGSPTAPNSRFQCPASTAAGGTCTGKCNTGKAWTGFADDRLPGSLLAACGPSEPLKQLPSPIV